MLDKNGYPTDEYLEKIKDAPSLDEALTLVQDAWHWPEYAKCPRPGIWAFATGGWSGNEDLLEALGHNPCFILSTKITLQGGLLVVASQSAAEPEIQKMQDKIVEWAWSELC